MKKIDVISFHNPQREDDYKALEEAKRLEREYSKRLTCKRVDARTIVATLK